jgi:hypothetical protein
MEAGNYCVTRFIIVTGGWRVLRDEVHNLCSSSNVIRAVKYRRLALHVAFLGDTTN